MTARTNARPSLLPPDKDEVIEQRLESVPEHGRNGLLLYLRFGVPPGHFLRAVLENDLAEACGRADVTNQRALYDYVFLLYNDAPSACWGSPSKVTEWIRQGRALIESQRHLESEATHG